MGSESVRSTAHAEGYCVKVTMTYEDRVKVPADAKAVIISPSVVGDRFVQLTPAYVSVGSSTLEDGAVLYPTAPLRRSSSTPSTKASMT